MLYATNRLIDSVWTLGYEVKGNSIEIHSYNRESKIGYEQEKELPQVLLIEDENRIVKSVKFRDYEPFNYGKGFDEVRNVSNPEYVFSYGEDKKPTQDDTKKTITSKVKR
jgi:hypothetical protein